MSHFHRIRLRGPWEVTPLESMGGNNCPQPTMMPCPCSWREGGWPHFSGKAIHLRRFGRPRSIDAQERMWLVIDPCRGELTIALNGRPIGRAAGDHAFEADVTELLSPRNELTIEVAGNDDSSGLTGEVRLEIRGVAK